MSIVQDLKIFKKYASPTFISSKTQDINVPFAFKDWYSSHQGIVPSQEYSQYSEYLINWYKEKSKTTENNSIQLKLRYLGLLRQLQLFLSKQETESWYNNIDFNNDKELLLSIPFFARKLKDISLYYLNLRNSIKESRLRYNQTGTERGIVEQLQNHILTEYTKRPDAPISIPSNIWQLIPELSSVKETLVIELEELYDDHSYFDKSPTVPLSAYYDLTSQDIENFLFTKNLTLSSLNWIYSSGIFPLSGSDSEFEELTNIFSKKYLGRDIFTSLPPQLQSETQIFNLPIQPGNNFFYWPSFINESIVEGLPIYEPLPLSSAGLETLGTAGSGLDSSDTIFIKNSKGIEGAWLKSEQFTTLSATMEAVLDASTKTTFLFPFPGYGLSGEDLEWTGFGLKTDKRYRYLKDDIKIGVESLYWSSNINLSTTEPLKIQDTTLIDKKAWADTRYEYADKLAYYPVAPLFENTINSNTLNESWLYRFTQTDIPIRAGESNVIVWPFERINPENPFPNYYPTNFSQVCQATPVSSLNTEFSIAGNSLSSSEVIYKLKNYQDPIEEALECCWLSGTDYFIPEEETIFPYQDNLQLQCEPNTFTRFVWIGPDYTDASKIFKSVDHSPDCKYFNTTNTTYKDFNLCNCRSIYFSPLGHPGENYFDYSSFTDFILEDDDFLGEVNLSEIDFNSSKFGWFKTNNKIGWGDGKWVSGDSSIGNVFYLRKNKKYRYYRQNFKDENTEILNLPPYTLRYSYNNTKNKVWVKAKKDIDGDWVSTQEPSKMTLYPGDILIFNRPDTFIFTLTGITEEETTGIFENRGSIWSNIDYVSINSEVPVIVSYPILYVPSTIPDPQYPEVLFNKIVNVLAWSLEIPGQPIQYFNDVASLFFTPTVSGIYTVALTALTGSFDGDEFGKFFFNNIPPITAVSNISLIPTFSSTETSLPGYVLNTPVYGWDYNMSSFSPYALIGDQGGKPFWAKSYYEKQDVTNPSGFPGVGIYQRIFDEHNVITQPQFSDITLETGSKIEYTRNYPTRIVWEQPLNFNIINEGSNWYTINFTTTSSNIDFFLKHYKEELIAQPTNNRSNIVFKNVIDNEPVGVYYNALNPFVWSIRVVPELTSTTYAEATANLVLEAIVPYANLANENFPTLAVFPTIENLYSKSESGGYFIPQNFGASKYVNKNYTVFLNTSSENLSSFFNDTEKLGLTLEIQKSPYEIIAEDNSWLKEPLNSNQLAGAINKQVYKTHQKFLPYQSAQELDSKTQIGIITPNTLLDPWSQNEQPQWLDSYNYPVSFEGELDIQKWTEQQLPFSGLQLDNWTSDIFGNQYGLYKPTTTDTSFAERRETPGQIWVKDNSQKILPASVALSEVFDTYKTTTLLKELTGLGVFKIDTFFDTLMIETSGVVFFEKLGYDFETDKIFSIADNSRRLSLALNLNPFLLLETYTETITSAVPAILVTEESELLETEDGLLLETEFSVISGFETKNGYILQEDGYGILLENTFLKIKLGETWFFPKQKEVIISIAATKNRYIFPELYRLNLIDLTFKKIFPLHPEDITSIISLSSLDTLSVDRPVLSYNSLKKEYVLVVTASNELAERSFIEFTIKDITPLRLQEIKVFRPTPSSTTIDLPYTNQTLLLSASLLIPFNFTCIAINNPTVFELLNSSWISVNENGVFTGIPTTQGIHEIPFKMTNSVGSTYYSLIINVL